MKKSIIFLTTISFILAGCARIYYSPEVKAAAEKHKIIAIISPNVSIIPRKSVDPEVLKEQQRNESLLIQKEMYGWLMRRKMQGKMWTNVLNVETTNARLAEAGYYEGKSLSLGEICKLLSVDGLIISEFSLSKPMSEEAALALGILLDFWGPTNETTVNLDLFDSVSENVIWNYYNRMSGTSFSTHRQLIDELLKSASRRMPYIIK